MKLATQRFEKGSTMETRGGLREDLLSLLTQTAPEIEFSELLESYRCCFRV